MNENQHGKFHAYIQGIILIGFSFLFLSFILTGSIYYYIAPKMVIFSHFAIIVFLILGIIQIWRSTKKKSPTCDSCGCDHEHEMRGSPLKQTLIYAIFIIPILSGFIVPNKALDSKIAANRGVHLGGIEMPSTNTEEIASKSFSRAEKFLENPDAYYKELGEKYSNPARVDSSMEEFYGEKRLNDYYQQLMETFAQQEMIEVTDENFLDVMSLLDSHLGELIGKEIEMTGFIYREPDFNDQQFVVARFSIICCVADASIYGTLVESESRTSLENNTWVTVRGVVSKRQYHDRIIPAIELDKLTVIDEPSIPYVYPTFRQY